MAEMNSSDLLQGTLDLLILQTLRDRSMHGWGIAQAIGAASGDVLTVQQGSLYPALRRLEKRRWVEAHWGSSENNRRARFYRLTRAGRRRLEAERAQWREISTAIGRILAGETG
jgi:PadR family transcriptional regulator PadR